MSHSRSPSSRSLTSALQRIEKTVAQQTPSNFLFSQQHSSELIKFLHDSVTIYDKLNLKLKLEIVFIKENPNDNSDNKYDFPHFYSQIIDKFLNLNPPFQPFTTLLYSKELLTMLQFVSWIVIYDLLDPCVCNPYMNDLRRTIYDRLSIDFSQLQMKLTNSTLSLSTNFIEHWCHIVCASIFSLILTLYEDSELYRNISFSLRIENDVRLHLVGFASPNVRDFHCSILSLMPKELKSALPTKVTVGGDDYNPTDLTNALTYEPQIQAAWDQKDSPLLLNSTTGLVQNAMKLKGTAIQSPLKPKGKTVKKGNVEKSGLPIAKAKIVLTNTERTIDRYKDDRSSIVLDICATEETYTEVPMVPPVTQLDVTFEDFGMKKNSPNYLLMNKPPVRKPSLPPLNLKAKNAPRPPMTQRQPKHRRSLNDSRKVTKPSLETIPLGQSFQPPKAREMVPGTQRFKYRKVPNIPEMITNINDINDYMLANPIF